MSSVILREATTNSYVSDWKDGRMERRIVAILLHSSLNQSPNLYRREQKISMLQFYEPTEVFKCMGKSFSFMTCSIIGILRDIVISYYDWKIVTKLFRNLKDT